MIKQHGFTLMELMIVVVILGILAAFAMPQFRDAIERAKVTEAYAFLNHVRISQEHYQALKGTYASALKDLTLKVPQPKDFDVGLLLSDQSEQFDQSWTLTLTRKRPSTAYGQYTITFNQDGFVSGQSTIQKQDRIQVKHY